MGKVSVFKPAEVVSILQRIGFVEACQRGSHTDDGEVVRIISAREPTRGEKESYEES
ncbi:MAG: hypothetical protein M3458_21455 [Acidobacteriota bacterium]|nr:hypothetical protein [Acidobacteriota bacterium]